MKDDFRKILSLTAFPRQTKLLDDPDGIIKNVIIGNYAPEAPILSASNKIACIGSCFAGEISKALANQGRNAPHMDLTEHLNTTFALRHYVDAALAGVPLPDGFKLTEFSQTSLELASEMIRTADAYIITLGLSLCWVELKTGKMVIQPPNGVLYGGLRDALLTHTMQATTVRQNVEQLNATLATIRRINPKAPVIFTLSPIPLFLAFTDTPSIAANNISKFTLRLALQEIWEQRLDNVYYWPSYDMIEWLAKYLGPVFGQDGDDLRHVSQPVIAKMMKVFSHHYFGEPQP